MWRVLKDYCKLEEVCPCKRQRYIEVLLIERLKNMEDAALVSWCLGSLEWMTEEDGTTGAVIVRGVTGS